ncbi:MAG: carboxymuconolactone decarboxylase family protein [Mycobacterium sp.]
MSEFTALRALSPTALADVNAAVRQTCAATLGLAPLPADAIPAADAAVLAFAEQFSVDVSVLSAEQRSAFLAATGDTAFAVAALIFVADFGPRVLAGLSALGLTVPPAPEHWDQHTDPGDLLLNGFAPAVAQLATLDPVTTEIVRLRGAVQHNCRLCRSLRDGTALDAGGSETLYDDIAHYEASDLLNNQHKAALRYVDALIWTPAHIPVQTAGGVRTHFTDTQATELTFDVMRNACNKIAVAFGADTPRVPEGTERYVIGADGQPVYR